MDRQRVGVVGAGIYGYNHLKAFSTCEEAELCAVCDLNPELRAKVEAEFGVHTYESVDEMIEQEHLDAVTVATPDCYHKDPALSAIRHGIPVLIEKPLATTLQDAREIIAEAKKYNVRVAVDYHKRWDPASIAIKNRLADPKCGAPIRGYMSMDDIIDVPTKWFKWSNNSSPVHFLGTHCYDLIRWYMGCEVTQVYAVGHKGYLSSLGADTLDSATAILTFENGCTWTVENSWILPDGFSKNNDGRTQIITEHELLRVDSQYRGVEIYNEQKYGTPNYVFMQEFNGRAIGFGYNPMYDFLRCLRTGEPFLADTTDGIEAEKIAEAVHESIETGKTVTIEREKSE
ncbi:MAG: Gfo/Idh/MocA family oxidoreductase [Solobacterium sp.]|nr:Gfo/Idh/MocA family oxidoreductase [Solobacterium sp.]